MVPAEFMQRAVAVLANAAPELFDLREELLTGHPFEIVIHHVVPFTCRRLTGGASAASEEPKAMSESAARAC
jgi:hypothetical protein